MDQEEPMDFQALRAKFQQEEFISKPPKTKPVIPEKPKVASPPQSPTYHLLPSGARPSLLSTINENLERKTLFAPRVVFADAKKESKTPLISTNAKGKNKSEGKLKGGKDKTLKGSRDNPEESMDQKKAKHKHKHKGLPLESTPELVPATPPPKVTTEKKKGLNIIKKPKRDSALISADPILDAPSSDVPGPAPLIPMPSELSSGALCNSTPESLLPDNPTIPDCSDDVEITRPSTILESFAFNPPPPLIPHDPAPEIPSPNSETPPEIENPALPVSTLASQNEIIPNPLIASSPSPLDCTLSTPSVVSTPSLAPSEPEITAETGKDPVYIPAEKKLSSSAINPPSIPPSPKAERPISALSALERAEDMSHGKRTTPGDQRILKALQNARNKTGSPLTNLTQSYSVTPPPEEPSPSQSPTVSLPELPPIDYEDQIGNALPSKTAHINGFDHQQPTRNNITEACDTAPELLVVPPPPPKMIISDTRPQNSSVAEPAISMGECSPPPVVEYNEIPAPPEFSETYTPYIEEVDIPDNVASDGHFPELPASELEYEKYAGPDVPDVPDGQDLPKGYSNGIIVPQTEIHTESPCGNTSQMNPPPESSLTVGHDLPVASEPHTDDDVYQDAENVYEYVATPEGGKKGVKTKVKKRKGQPKNPYVEPTPETVQEKTKLGRFGKTEKKTAAEGPDEKELKKKEKQRLEKEKKELKEKQEREKKEQKEREKKENELRKKFKITGQEDALYQAKVVVTAKGRKTDLPVKMGDTISIIRTGNCPKGKWLARDSSNNYGYVSVDHVELDIKEMFELGKKTFPSSNSNLTKPSRTRTSSQASDHYHQTGDSFTDDSEEWTGDDEPLSSPDASNPEAPLGHTRTFSMPDMGNKDLNINHQHSRSDMGANSSHNQALQKLANFFDSQKSVESVASTTEPAMSYTAGVLEEATHIPNKTQTSYTADPVNVAQEANHTSQTSSTENTDFAPDKLILPPPDMYADRVMVE